MSTFYWDLTDRERAELTEEQVREYFPAELMHYGYEQPEEPTYEVEETIEFVTKTYYGVERRYGESYWRDTELLFHTAKEAEDYAAVQTLHLKGGYGDEPHVADECVETRIVSKQAIPGHVYAVRKQDAERAAKIKKRNADKKKNYKDATVEIEECLDWVWDDYRECRRWKSTAMKVEATLCEYKQITGEEEVAKTFLAKRYTEDELRLWKTWTEGLDTCDENRVRTRP